MSSWQVDQGMLTPQSSPDASLANASQESEKGHKSEYKMQRLQRAAALEAPVVFSRLWRLRGFHQLTLRSNMLGHCQRYRKRRAQPSMHSKTAGTEGLDI